MSESLFFAENSRRRIIPGRVFIVAVPEADELIGKTVAELRRVLYPANLPENKYVPVVSGSPVGEDYVFQNCGLRFEYDPNKK